MFVVLLINKFNSENCIKVR